MALDNPKPSMATDSDRAVILQRQPASAGDTLQTLNFLETRTSTFEKTGWRSFIAPVRVDGWLAVKVNYAKICLLRTRNFFGHDGKTVLLKHDPLAVILYSFIV